VHSADIAAVTTKRVTSHACSAVYSGGLGSLRAYSYSMVTRLVYLSCYSEAVILYYRITHVIYLIFNEEPRRTPAKRR